MPGLRRRSRRCWRDYLWP